MPNERTSLIDSQLETSKECIQKIKSETRTWVPSAASAITALIPTIIFIIGVIIFNRAGKESSVLQKYADTPDGSTPIPGKCGQTEPLNDVCASRDYSINALCEQVANNLCFDETPYNTALDLLIMGGIFAAVLYGCALFCFAKRNPTPHVVSDLTPETQELLKQLNLPFSEDTSVQEVLIDLQNFVARNTQVNARNLLLTHTPSSVGTSAQQYPDSPSPSP